MNCREARRAIVLDHYGELEPEDRKRLDTHVGGCAACAADRDDTRRVLNLVSEPGSVTVPALNADQSWWVVRAGLRGATVRRAAFLGLGLRWSLAASAAVLVLVAGIVIGRFGFTSRTTPKAPGLASTASPVRTASTVAPVVSLQPTVAAHLEDLQPILLDFANSVGGDRPGPVVTVDERLLRGLLLQNLLLRRALDGREAATTELLDDLDLILKEIVNASGPGGARPAQIRGLIEDRGVLFRIQVLKTGV